MRRSWWIALLIVVAFGSFFFIRGSDNERDGKNNTQVAQAGPVKLGYVN